MTSPSNIQMWVFPDDQGNTAASAKICRKCREANPKDAVVCWACYAPLSSGDDAKDLSWEQQRKALVRRLRWRTRWEKCQNALYETLLPTALTLFVVSGYVAGYHVLLVVCGFVCFGIWLCWSRWNAAQHARALLVEEPPIQRITNTILLYAVRDGARTIVMRAGVEGIQCECLIGDEWQEQMRLPSYIWDELRDHIAARSENWERPVRFEQEAVSGSYIARLEHLFPHQTIVLMWENAAPTTEAELSSVGPLLAA